MENIDVIHETIIMMEPMTAELFETLIKKADPPHIVVEPVAECDR